MRRILPCLLAAIVLPARAGIPLETGPVNLPVQLVRDGRTTMLVPHKSLAPGDIVKTGNRASAELHFAGDGIITLGGNSQLYIHSASPPSMGYGAILRLQLLNGDLTLDAYPASNTIAQDYRLNVGVMQVRALGADLWAFNSGNVAAVCLRQGAVEITGSAGAQRLDIVGQCAEHPIGDGINLLPPGQAEALKTHLLGTEQPDSSLSAAATSIDDHAPTPQLVATPDPAPPVSKPAVTRDSGHHWVVVVAAARDRHAAEIVAAKMRGRNLKSTIRETGKSANPFSVTFGDFSSRGEAKDAAHKLAMRYGFKSVRVAALAD